MPWGPEGCITAFNSLLRLPSHMGSAKSSAVPWQGAWFVVCLKLSLSKEGYQWREFSFLALFKTQNLARVLKLLSRAERSLAWLCCTGANPTFHSCAHCNLVLPVPPQLGGLLKGGSSSEAF